MKPLQVYIDDVEFERLDTWSRQRGWTKSQAIRAAIRALKQPQQTDPVLSLSGMVQGLPADCSEHFDRYLNETFVAEAPAQYRDRPRRPKSPVRR